ncbi:hypothetical protein M378DRAFT_571610 [Amanita muscaria Koide BX008]|uniref:Uncharacterized protein n=1 Tax=Amanita muscaria (strain Koide BX008) TaxID=946122 RepID=A0A0C2SN96_AMAMK|nr:hypothetical protein M378DRAFT_571610 [Amanita muscaria Koide BX008]
MIFFFTICSYLAASTGGIGDAYVVYLESERYNAMKKDTNTENFASSGERREEDLGGTMSSFYQLRS